MGKKAQILIKEEVLELKKLLKQQTTNKNINRVRCLLYLKESKFRTRKELSDYLNCHIRTMERWLLKYTEGGLSLLLSPMNQNKSPYLIPEKVRIGLEKRVFDQNQGFLSYVEAQQWVKQEYDLDLNYTTLRSFLIKHFKTKIKRPRKSHTQKQKGAEEAFLKTALHAEQH